MDVVLPVPGPPVITVSPPVAAAITARRWASQSCTPSSLSYRRIWLSASSASMRTRLWKLRRSISSSAVSRSTFSSFGRYTARSPSTSSSASLPSISRPRTVCSATSA